MGKNRYYLFARNKDTNKVKSIPLSDFDIYKDGNNNLKNYNSLEEIDIFTTSYDREEDIIMYLVNTNRLDSYNNELFIVSRNGGKYSFMENIYADSHLLAEVRSFALSDESRGDKLYQNETILNYFIGMMGGKKFRRFIESKYHNIYSLFVKYFDGCYDEKMYRIKYKDGAWALKSYQLLRNIVEAINRFYKINDNNNDIVNQAKNYKDSLDAPRTKSDADIMFYTDKGYNTSQLSLLNESVEADKLSELEKFIDKLDENAFYKYVPYPYVPYYRLKGFVYVNPRFFHCSEIEYKQLNNLNINLKNALYDFILYKMFIKESVNDSYIADSFINNKKSSILEILKNDDSLLNKFYAFSLLYNKLSDKKEEKGQSYQKKQ